MTSEEVPRRDSALRAVLEGLPDAVVATGEDGHVDFVNERASELFGYSPAELVGQPVAVLWPERVRRDYMRNMRRLFNAGGSLRFTREAYGRRKDGGEFVGEMSWGLVETAEGPLMLAVGRDISQRLLTEARLGRRSAENAVVAALGERALAGTDPAALGPQVVRDVAETVEADLTALFELTADGRELRTLAVWGERDERSGAIQVGLGSHAQAALDAPDALSLSDDPGSALNARAFEAASRWRCAHRRRASACCVPIRANATPSSTRTAPS